MTPKYMLGTTSFPEGKYVTEGPSKDGHMQICELGEIECSGSCVLM